jgi:hypothetical protein
MDGMDGMDGREKLVEAALHVTHRLTRGVCFICYDPLSYITMLQGFEASGVLELTSEASNFIQIPQFKSRRHDIDDKATGPL